MKNRVSRSAKCDKQKEHLHHDALLFSSEKKKNTNPLMALLPCGPAKERERSSASLKKKKTRRESAKGERDHTTLFQSQAKHSTT